jgi:small subunit ribosomal protein S17
MQRSVVVQREYDVPVAKYDRKMKRRSRVPAHVPEVLEPIPEGATVKIAETRPLSKTKSHVVVQVIDGAASDEAAGQPSGDSREEGGEA